MPERTRWFGQCVFCRKWLLLLKRKDLESFTGEEVLHHIEIAHPGAWADWQNENPFGMPAFIQKAEYELNAQEVE